MIKLQYLPPPAELAAFVSAYYLFETDEASFEDLERADEQTHHRGDREQKGK